jgi:hypothetical protein
MERSTKAKTLKRKIEKADQKPQDGKKKPAEKATVDANKGQLNEEEKTFPNEGEDEDDSPSLLQCYRNPWLRADDKDDLPSLATFQNWVTVPDPDGTFPTRNQLSLFFVFFYQDLVRTMHYTRIASVFGLVIW